MRKNKTSKSNKVNKKALFAFSTLAITSMATIGALFGLNVVRNNNSNIVLHTGDDTPIVLSTNDVESLEAAARKEINAQVSYLSSAEAASYSNTLISTYEDADGDGLDDTTGEPIDDGTTEPSQDSVTSLTSKWIQIAFFNAALVGEFDGQDSVVSIDDPANPDNDDDTDGSDDDGYNPPGTDQPGDGSGSDVIDSKGGWDTQEALEGSIMNPASDSSWEISSPSNMEGVDTEDTNDEQLSPEALYIRAVEAKFYTETTSSGQTAYQYLLSLASTDRNVATSCSVFIGEEMIKYQTLWDMKAYTDGVDGSDLDTDPTNQDPEDVAVYNRCINAVASNVDYKLSLLKFGYVYTYLWQPTVGSFDYYLTQNMVSQQAAFIWKVDVNNIRFFYETKYNYMSGLGLAEQESIKGTTTDLEWSELAADPDVTGTTDLSLTDQPWDVNFMGIEYKASTTTVTNGNLWSTSQAYNYNENTNGQNGYDVNDYTTLGQYGLTSLYNPMMYEENNVVIRSDTTSETGQLIAATLIYPFSFADNADNVGQDNASADGYKYSMNAYVTVNGTTAATGFDSSSEIQAAVKGGAGFTDDDPTLTGQNGNTTSLRFYPVSYGVQTGQISDDVTKGGNGNGYIDAGDAGVVSVFELLPVIDKTVGQDLDTMFWEVLIVYDLYSSLLDTLESKAYLFWNNKGFYIDLNGKYETEYGSLIPQGLQKQD